MSDDVARFLVAAIKFAISCASEESELMKFAEDNRAVIDLLPEASRDEVRAEWKSKRDHIRRYS